MSVEAPRVEPVALSDLAGDIDAPLRALASECDRLFRVYSPWAPGLTIIGAQADPAGFGALAGAPRLSATGAGFDLASAATSCLAELAERLSLCEQEGDVALSAPVAAVGEALFPALRDSVARRAATAPADHMVDWARIEDFEGRSWLAPADDLLLRPRRCGLRQPGVPVSTGAAAGRTPDDARRSAAFEVLERAAAARWWGGAAPGRAPRVDADAEIARLRGDAQARRTLLLDVTPPGWPSCLVAVTQDRGRNGGFVFGAACRADAESAARAAVREAAQNETGLLFARLRAAANVAAPPSDAGHLARDAWGGDARLDAAEARRGHEELATDRLKSLFDQGYRVAQADLTRARIGVVVVKLCAPAPAVSPHVAGAGYAFGKEPPMF